MMWPNATETRALRNQAWERYQRGRRAQQWIFFACLAAIMAIAVVVR